MPSYSHTQYSTVFIIFFMATSAIVAFALAHGKQGAEIAFFIVAFVLLLFFRLTIRVNEQDVSLVFGIGLVKKRIPLESISSVKTVQNAWYHGWGVRLLSNGILYNVTGFQAVELLLQDETVVRLGSNQPEQLKEAIAQRLPVSEQEQTA